MSTQNARNQGKHGIFMDQERASLPLSYRYTSEDSGRSADGTEKSD